MRGMREDKACRTKLTIVPVLGLHPILSVLLHLVRRCVVTVGQALLNKLVSIFKKVVKEVRREGEMIWLDLKKSNILLDHLCAKSTIKESQSLPLHNQLYPDPH